MPNLAGIHSVNWTNYITCVNRIQADTGYTFFTALSSTIASALRAEVDGGVDHYPSAGKVVISQVDGGRRQQRRDLNKNDFIELYNSGSAAVDLSTYAVQYASATGSNAGRRPRSAVPLLRATITSFKKLREAAAPKTSPPPTPLAPSAWLLPPAKSPSLHPPPFLPSPIPSADQPSWTLSAMAPRPTRMKAPGRLSPLQLLRRTCAPTVAQRTQTTTRRTLLPGGLSPQQRHWRRFRRHCRNQSGLRRRRQQRRDLQE